MKRIIFAITAMFLLAACSSDDSETTPVTPLYNGVLLKKMVQTFEGGTPHVVNYTYSGNKIISAAGEDGYTFVYFYTGDQITMIQTINNFNQVIRTGTFAYHPSGYVSVYRSVDPQNHWGAKIVYVRNADGTMDATEYTGDENSQTEISGTRKYFPGANGDTELQEVYFPGGTKKYEYTYDEKNDPFKNVLGFKAIDPEGHRYNVTQMTARGFDGSVENTEITDYDYDAQDFPTHSVKTSDHMSTLTTQYYY